MCTRRRTNARWKTGRTLCLTPSSWKENIVWRILMNSKAFLIGKRSSEVFIEWYCCWILRSPKWKCKRELKNKIEIRLKINSIGRGALDFQFGFPSSQDSSNGIQCKIHKIWRIHSSQVVDISTSTFYTKTCHCYLGTPRMTHTSRQCGCHFCYSLQVDI